MNKEFKIVLFLLFFLLTISTFLLKILADIRIFSQQYLYGFLPFALLLAPYMLFSTEYCINYIRKKIDASLLKKFLFPFYLLIIYTIFSILYTKFQWQIFIRLSLWLLIPSFLLCLNQTKNLPFYLSEFIAVLMLWLPLEFGQVGFDIYFKEGIQIPAMAFVAPCLGLYLFAILKNLSGIGYNFRWQWQDLTTALIALIILAALVIPLGTSMGFIRYSILKVSLSETFKLVFGIYFLVALPEELLFRGIIQNLISKILSKTHRFIPLLIASVIFGLSHWNNFSPADWRYVFLATVAGIFYGFTYMKTGKTTVSALVHCGVNFCWAILFKDTAG